MSAKKKSPGRPRSKNPAKERLPVVQVTPDKLLAYKRAAVALGVKFSEFTRDALDDFVKFVEKGRTARIKRIKEGERYRFIFMDGIEQEFITEKILNDTVHVHEPLRCGIGPYIHFDNSFPRRHAIKLADIYDVRGYNLDDEVGTG